MTPEVEKALAEIAASGELIPDRVVEAARDPASALHAYFTWDNDEAAKRWRAEQARALIRSVKIEVIVEERAIVVPRYVHDPDAPSGGYVATASIAPASDKAVRVMHDELQRVLGALERARAVAATLGLSDVVERTIAAARAAQEELKKAA